MSLVYVVYHHESRPLSGDYECDARSDNACWPIEHPDGLKPLGMHLPTLLVSSSLVRWLMVREPYSGNPSRHPVAH